MFLSLKQPPTVKMNNLISQLVGVLILEVSQYYATQVAG